MSSFCLSLKTVSLALVTLMASSSAWAQEIWIVTDATHPVSAAVKPTRVINLDEGQRIEAALSASLPSDPQRAAAVVRERFSQGGSALQQRMQAAYQDLVHAWSLGITTIPAIVVDRRYVVYGEQDVERALARIVQYREEQP